MNREQLTLQDMNHFSQDEFIAALSGLFEGEPWIVAQAWSLRPFASVAALHHALCTVMYQASIRQQIALIQAHPDLVGRAALAGTLSSSSANEQEAAGLTHLTTEEVEIFQRYNQAYTERFGFPFVICARENKKESILAGFAARLPNTREQEITTALDEIAKICAYRLYDLIADEHVPRL